MAWLNLQGGSSGVLGGSALGNSLTDLLMCAEIQPGSAPSYAVCKTLYSFHPIGKKMVDAPIEMAQSQQRDVSVASAPSKRVVEAFLDERKAMRADRHVANLASVARRYGQGTMVLIVKDDLDTLQPLDLKTLAAATVGFNVLDPLNTAAGNVGVLTQDPNSIAFQNTAERVVVAGKPYHASRTCVLVNESAVYIEFTNSAFGYTGRSVYQRALYPLKTFVQTMRTDDLVVRKAGVIVTKIKQVGSMVDNVMAAVVGQKRQVARDAVTDDVMSVGNEDSIESMNLQNLEGPYTLARRNVIDNIAAASAMPAIILNSQTFAEGFGEGTEDAKGVARYVDGVREDMAPAYDFTDRICQHRAWSPEFYATIQRDFPEEYGGVSYEEAFFSWTNSFRAEWPSLLIEPESERVEVDKVRFEASTKAMEVLLPKLDPMNTVRALQWYVDTFNDQPLLFKTRFDLDLDELEAYVAKLQEQQEQLAAAAAEKDAGEAEDEPKPRADSVILLGKRK